MLRCIKGKFLIGLLIHLSNVLCYCSVPFPKSDIANRWTVELGRYNVSAPTEATEQSFNISSLYVHSEFHLDEVKKNSIIIMFCLAQNMMLIVSVDETTNNACLTICWWGIKGDSDSITKLEVTQ